MNVIRNMTISYPTRSATRKTMACARSVSVTGTIQANAGHGPFLARWAVDARVEQPRSGHDPQRIASDRQSYAARTPA
jgi:hypothetical protein